MALKVAVLNDHPISGPTNPGHGSGAELSIGQFMKTGHARGHNVDVVYPRTFNQHTLNEYDLFVTKGLTQFNRQQLEAIMGTAYVAWPSDYYWTRWRLFFAYQEHQRDLPKTEFWHQFLTQTRFNVFLSPLHRDAYAWVMPGVEEHEHMVVPPQMDTEPLVPSEDGHGEDTACVVNGGLPFKGLHNHLDWCKENPDTQFFFLGSIRDGVNLPPNAEHTGRLPRGQLIDFLARTERYVELPSTVQPFNRTAIEGFLCCGTVETNELLGAASYAWFQDGDRDAAREAVSTANEPFWDRIEKEVGT